MQTLLLLALAVAAGPEVVVEAHDAPRRWVLGEAPLPKGMDAPVHLQSAGGEKVPVQVSDGKMRFVIASIPAGKALQYMVMPGAMEGARNVELNATGDFIGVKVSGREVTRYHHGAWAKEHKKPFWYPLVVDGVNLCRSWPMEDGREGERKDHPHHTAIYHTYDEVSGRNFWSKRDTITPLKVLRKESGPAYARIVAEHGWGPDLVEKQDVVILNSGNDVVMDWTITMTAANGTVEFGKTKEGGFSCRVTTGLTNRDGGKVTIVDAKGNEGEPAIRKDAASWVDYFGKVDGKVVGVSIMDHPTSFRYPTTWHVRGYGCFAANRWFVNGGVTLKKGDSFTVRYRLYAHGGDTKQAKVAATYAGFAHARVSVKD